MNKLYAIRRAVRPWHIWASVVAVIVIVGAVLAGVLVSERNHEKAIEEDKDTPSDPTIARVNLGYAQYQGSLVGHDGGIAQYLRMRYAAPPTGDHRWRAPVEPEVDDSGDQAADSFGPICLGISMPYPNNNVQDEDCLYVNVWAPANATLESELPVWLFIQGGGYTINANANWNGTTVVQRSGRNIVFVNFNYRVGLWGFLASERVRADGAGDLNVGLRDQIEVMRWVRRNIAQFGGDPDHVVIHGASAGAGSVALHLLMSYSNGTNNSNDNGPLFVGGIGESVFFPAQPTVADLEWQFDRLLSQIGCASSSSSDPMSCLRSKDTATLQGANIPSPFPGRLGFPLFYWTPCIDGELLRDSPYALFERGEFVDVPVMMGTTTDEGTVFASNAQTPDDVENFMRDNYPNLTDTQSADILEQYPKMAELPAHGPYFPSAAAAYGETTFICPATSILNSYIQHWNTSRAWGYRYDVYDAQNAAQGLGVPHIWESWAVFGPDSLAGQGHGPRSYYDAKLAGGVVAPVMDYWISFIRTLDPSALRNTKAPTWEPWGEKESRMLMQANNFTMEIVPPDQATRCEFWRGLAPAMQQRRKL